MRASAWASGTEIAWRAEVEQHLDECRLCGGAVEGVAALEWRGSYLRATESILARIRSRNAHALKASAAARRWTPRFHSAPAYLTLAASLLAGVSVFFWTRPGPGEVLFQQYFEPYPSTRPVVRGGAAEGRPDALALYEARDYHATVAMLEARLEREPNDAAVLFYMGLSRLALGQDREAILALEEVLRLPENDFHIPAEWYLALAHLHRRDLGAARSELQGIAATGGFYQDRARSLLSELNRLDHDE